MRYVTAIIIAFVILAILYFLSVIPQVRKRKDLSKYKNAYFAHRGLHNNDGPAPENSLAAFRKAVDAGLGMELDIQLTKDKIPVVFHDYNLKRACGVDKRVDELTLNDLKQLKLFNSKEKIPTFKEFLRTVDGKTPLIIEYKIEGMDLSLCDIAIKQLDEYKGDFCIESFNPMCLRWFKKNRPDIIRGQLATHLKRDGEKGNPILFFLLRNMMLNFIAKPDFIAFNHIHTDMLSFKICRKLFKTPTFAWTIKSEENVKSASKDFDSYIFDSFFPEAVRSKDNSASE
ncbi:MAG: glycerophosphodiester phosphodiesterase family protein [Acutalibacteraceae bacterium]